MWVNPLMKALLNSPLHGLVSKNMMVLSYHGRKTHAPYALPVNYVRLDDTLLTLSLPERTWWRNLRGGAPVMLRLQGQDVPATAVVSEDPTEVAALLERLLEAAPQYAKYLNVPLEGDAAARQTAVVQAAQQRVVVRMTPE